MYIYFGKKNPKILLNRTSCLGPCVPETQKRVFFAPGKAGRVGMTEVKGEILSGAQRWTLLRPRGRGPHPPVFSPAPRQAYGAGRGGAGKDGRSPLPPPGHRDRRASDRVAPLVRRGALGPGPLASGLRPVPPCVHDLPVPPTPSVLPSPGGGTSTGARVARVPVRDYEGWENGQGRWFGRKPQG